MDTQSQYDNEEIIPAIEHARVDTFFTVSYLADLADGRDVLDFGVGAGRLAIPLAESARSVVGIDISRQTLQGIENDVPSNLKVIEADARTWRSTERFHLVLCAWNFLLLFPSQDSQLGVVFNAARHLAAGGYLVIENVYPPLRALEEGRRVVNLDLPDNDTAILFQSFEWKTMRAEQKVLYLADGTIRTRRFTMRMIFPAEQDLMARMAGLVLVKRMSNWRGTPWAQGTSGSSESNVISIYRHDDPQ